MALIQNLLNVAENGGYADPFSMLSGIVGGLAKDRSAAVPTTRSSPSVVPLAGHGRVTIRPGADRPGFGLSPRVVDFAKQISALAGHPIEIGTGTNHNQFVVGTRRQSKHWTGDAADIPAVGASLTRLGQAALVAAGMSPSQAARLTGGLYNVGGYQIIFNSDVGGNHWNHLHVGLR